MTSDGTAGVHPDVNALADLAADVLGAEEARTVEAHVISCPDCADLLADAERIRPLLLADDIGPMPDDVWTRISGTLAEEASARSALQGPPVPLSPVPAPSGAPWGDHWSVHEGGAAPQTADRADREHQVDQAGDAPGGDATGYTRVIRPLADLTPASATERTEESVNLPALGASRVSGLRRPGRGSGPSRRDVRESAREESGITGALRRVQGGVEKGVVRGRRGAVLAVAAGVVVAAGLGGIVWSVVGDRFGATGSTATSAEGGAAAPAAAALAPVLATDKNYTPGKLAAEAKALVARAEKGGALATAAATQGDASTGAGAEPGPASRAVSGPAPGSREASSKLSQPGVLAACLDALSATEQRPLAVDIARYDGREAAVIVLQGEDGSLEVWAVSRDCGSGNEVPLTFLSVPK